MLYSTLYYYAIVGFCSNAALYFIYLVATSFGIGYKTAMILLYTIGILLTFLFNRCWTFDHQGLGTKAFIRYISVYGLGYVFNLATLFLLQRFFVLNDKQQVTI